MGSNVVDRFHRVRKIPKIGAKAYFASSEVVDTVVVGGVTLNHLAWASLMNVPTGLLALQGEDESGRHIRSALDEHGISKIGVKASKEYCSSESLIFTEESGERSIIMATAATSMINKQIVHDIFRPFIVDSPKAKMITTEVSQAPLSGVREVLRLAREQKAISFIDVDVPPTVAEAEAKLGTAKEVSEVAGMADVVKPTLDAAIELLADLDPSGGEVSSSIPLSVVAKRLLKIFPNCKMAAVTDGNRGAGIANREFALNIPCFKINKVEDSTGAGDAFFGGLVAGVYHWGLPKSEKDLERIGSLAAALGAACVQQRGALPQQPKTTDLLTPLLSKEAVEFYNKRREKQQQQNTAKNSSSSSSPSNNSEWSFEASLKDDHAALSAQLHNATAQANVITRLRDLLLETKQGGRRLFTTGLGKSGHVAARLATSLSSLGVPAEFVHAVEWLHGDLGKFEASPHKNVVIAFSHSGESSEIVGLIPHFKLRGVIIVAITSNKQSSLAKAADLTLISHATKETELIQTVPTSSVVVQEAISNAILRTVGPITAIDFKKNHPGGAIGAAKK